MLDVLVVLTKISVWSLLLFSVGVLVFSGASVSPLQPKQRDRVHFQSVPLTKALTASWSGPQALNRGNPLFLRKEKVICGALICFWFTVQFNPNEIMCYFFCESKICKTIWMKFGLVFLQYAIISVFKFSFSLFANINISDLQNIKE